MLRGTRLLIVLSIFLLLSLVMLPTSSLSQQTTVSAATQEATSNAAIATLHTLVKQSGKDTRIPLRPYSAMSNQLQAALLQLGVPDDPESVFDLNQANYFVDWTTSTLKQIVVPLCGSGSAKLSATDSKTPDGGKAAKIVGAVYDPLVSKTAMVLVYVPDTTPALRFYTGIKGAIKPYELTTLELRKFTGIPPEQKQSETQAAVSKCRGASSAAQQDKSANQPTVFDQGAVISALETCFTVGLDQVCYRNRQPDPKAQETVQDGLISLLAAADAKNSPTFSRLSTVKFDIPGAVSDLMGDTQRLACAKALAEADDPQAWPEACRPTVMFTAVKYNSLSEIPTLPGYEDKRLLGLLVVVSKTGLKLDSVGASANPNGEIYNASPIAHVDVLPPGAYLWFNAEPAAPLSNNWIALFLVNSKGKGYYITGYRLEGFGQTDSKDAASPLQAAVKDPVGGGGGCP